MAVLDAELRRAAAARWPRDWGSGPASKPCRWARPSAYPRAATSGCCATRWWAGGPRAPRLRLKIAPGWDMEPVRTVREMRPELALQVDANGSYRLGTGSGRGSGGGGVDDPASADGLARLADWGVLCVEQPLPPADLAAHAELGRRLGVPICLDESLTSPRRVLDALRYGACQVACLKPGRLGGLGAARQAHAACVDAGVPVFVGGFFEAGLGRAANLALAASLAQQAVGLVGDLGDPPSYLAIDPCGYPAVRRAGSRCPSTPASGRPRRRIAWPSWRCSVAGSRPRTLDAPCIAPSSSDEYATCTPAWCGRAKSWPCSTSSWTSCSRPPRRPEYAPWSRRPRWRRTSTARPSATPMPWSGPGCAGQPVDELERRQDELLADVAGAS